MCLKVTEHSGKTVFKVICAYSQGALVMAVFVQDKVPALVYTYR